MLKRLWSIFLNRNAINYNLLTKRISANLIVINKLNNFALNSSINRDISNSSSFVKFDNRNFRRKKIKDNFDEKYFDVIAYSTGEEYNLENIKTDLVHIQSLKLLAFPEDAYDTLHLKLSSDTINDVFIFKEGSVVFWNFPDDQKSDVLQIIKKNQLGSYTNNLIEEQKETFKFAITNHCSLLDGDIYVDPSDKKHQLQLFTFSNALSLSVKLAIWEAFLDQYVGSIKYVLEDLKVGKIKIGEAEVIRKAGELFSLSHSINLSSDLLDTPDIYWDHDELDKLFSQIYQYLSISRRTKVMNEKIRQCFDLINLVRDYLKDFHHTRLEYMIIFLIFIEVVFGVYHITEKIVT